MPPIDGGDSGDSVLPVDSSDGVPPIDGSDSVLPVDGSDGVPPVDRSDSGDSVLPVDGSDGIPPVDGSNSVLPVDGSDGIPPVDGCEGVPPVDWCEGDLGCGDPRTPTYKMGHKALQRNHHIRLVERYNSSHYPSLQNRPDHLCKKWFHLVVYDDHTMTFDDIYIS